MDEDAKLSIHIQNKNPIELIDLTESLLSLGGEYKRFVQRHSDLYVTSDVKLYVKEMRTGSIWTELVSSAVPLVAPLFENRKSIIEFAKWLKQAYDYFKGSSIEKPQLDKTSYNNLANFLQPVAKDNGSQLNVSNTVNGQQVVNININSLEANAIQNLIQREIQQLQEPVASLKEKVVLYWYQAKNDPLSSTGDKGVIESISPQAVKVVFSPESLKMNMLYKDENPFKSAYIVDVMVETIENRPVLYKVVGFHGELDK